MSEALALGLLNLFFSSARSYVLLVHVCLITQEQVTVGRTGCCGPPKTTLDLVGKNLLHEEKLRFSNLSNWQLISLHS
jgi:hypothetical protein